MSNSDNENDPRLRQDKMERKDQENSSFGMIAGVIIVVLAIVGLYLYYTLELAPTTAVVPASTAVVTTPTTNVNPAPNAPANAVQTTPNTPAANQNNMEAPVSNQTNNVPATVNQ